MSVSSQTQIPAEPPPDAGTQRRDALLRAHAVIEAVIAGLDLTSWPKDVTYHEYNGAYEVDIYISESADAVRNVAHIVDTTVTTKPHPTRPGTIRTEARATVRGIPIRAWTQTTTDTTHATGTGGAA
ncbi:hypothetical protein ACWEFL_15935 [Streptomyces sp. NPDC004838]